MGGPAWAADPRLDSVGGRLASEAEINDRISRWTGNQDAYQVMDVCQRAGVPAGVVQTGADLAERDPQLRASGFLKPIEDVSSPLGQTWADRLPIYFERTPCDDYARVREVGEDNAAVLNDWLQMDEAAIRDAEAQGLLR
jgi:crotonobetainyl-CoA:carnitine CoA-transferase CaiB-like acyl-CoA transferase